MSKELSLTKKAWLRFLARRVDMTILVLIISFLLGGFIQVLYYNALLPYSFLVSLSLHPYIYGIIVTIFYFFLEAFLLSKYKTTPAKKLLGIKITDKNGERLSFKNALFRGFILWLLGLGLGIPLISIIAIAIAFSNYTTNGTTYWDKRVESNLEFNAISPLRFAIGVILFIASVIIDIYFISL